MTTGEQLDVTTVDDSCPAPAFTPTRRQWLGVLAGLGVGSSVFQRALAAQVQQATEQQATTVTAEMVQQAEWISGLKLADADRRVLAQAMTGALNNFQRMRAVALPNSVPPAVNFNPAPW